MPFRFFIGANHLEINVKNKDSEPEANYAWCLEKAIIDFRSSKTNLEQIQVLRTFEKNMGRLEVTKKMLEQAQSEFNQIITANPLPSNEHVTRLLMSIPVPDKGYLELAESPLP